MTMTALRTLKAGDLSLTPIDHASPVPLYHQIENDLKRLILSGALVADDVLPPENELSKQYGVGRHTMRMALSRLTMNGFISRQAGRGTFVVYRPHRQRFYLDRSFTRQMADMGMTAHSQVLSAESGVLDDTALPPLCDYRGARYYAMTRLRFGDHVPVGLQSTTILTRLCPGIDAYDFNEQSLYDVLFSQYHLLITRIVHTIRAVIADAAQGELLGRRAGDPLLLVNTSAYLESGELIEYTTSYYRADTYEYSTTHTYSPDAPAD